MTPRGFSLIEIAVVLVIISVLLAIVAQPLSAQLEGRRAEETRRQLEAAKEALIGYALSNGRLPCPATAASNGSEAFASGTAAQGNCSQFNGFLPAATLGLSPVDENGFAVDAWANPANRVRYAVKDLNLDATPPSTCPIPSVTHVLTRTDGMRTVTMSCLADASAEVDLLRLCAVTPTGAAGSATGCTSLLSNKVPFVVFSMGKNAAGTPGTDESHNLDADSYFVSHPPTDASAPSGEFDDLVTWGSLNTLFARMVQAGKLP